MTTFTASATQDHLHSIYFNTKSGKTCNGTKPSDTKPRGCHQARRLPGISSNEYIHTGGGYGNGGTSGGHIGEAGGDVGTDGGCGSDGDDSVMIENGDSGYKYGGGGVGGDTYGGCDGAGDAISGANGKGSNSGDGICNGRGGGSDNI